MFTHAPFAIICRIFVSPTWRPSITASFSALSDSGLLVIVNLGSALKVISLERLGLIFEDVCTTLPPPYLLGGQIATPGKFVKRDWDETSSGSENPCVALL